MSLLIDILMYCEKSVPIGYKPTVIQYNPVHLSSIQALNEVSVLSTLLIAVLLSKLLSYVGFPKYSGTTTGMYLELYGNNKLIAN